MQFDTSCNTVLVGDETYLLVLLCYHASLESHDLFFCPEPKKNTKQPRVWNIKAVKQRLGPDICQHILILHAVLGCEYNILPLWDWKGNFPREIPNDQRVSCTGAAYTFSFNARCDMCSRDSIGVPLKWKID